jgi:hypothetical protein
MYSKPQLIKKSQKGLPFNQHLIIYNFFSTLFILVYFLLCLLIYFTILVVFNFKILFHYLY